ncbi:MAG: DUF3422 domain-containing protein [Pseudorhodobacter sp.]|nr:DUF3422 domain-containing protein [Pseudorhodobacter sp.]
MPILDHPLRYDLVNELHARPFPVLTAPCTAMFVAIKEPEDQATRDREVDRAHLVALLDRHATAHPPPGATHYSGAIGRAELKWESHTEFVTYSAFTPGVSARPFDPIEAEVLPGDWLAQAPGQRVASVLLRVELMPDDENVMVAKLESWFVVESLAAARVIEGAAVVATDFRIDPAGHMRFAVFVKAGTQPARVGRIVQRLCEIETYRAMSMLGLIRARELGAALNRLDPRLSTLMADLNAADRSPEDALHDLLTISADLEQLAVAASFRFGATLAYEAIVTQRIEALREQRYASRQTFGKFMMRRYDPAMRTVKSTDARLKSLAERAQRAADLLRTRVDVQRSAQNQELLGSMDRRADLALRLQHTVEGLSVVAISYYAVSLTGYVAAPVLEGWMTKTAAMAVLTPLVVAGVWLMVRRIRKGMH